MTVRINHIRETLMTKSKKTAIQRGIAFIVLEGICAFIWLIAVISASFSGVSFFPNLINVLYGTVALTLAVFIFSVRMRKYALRFYLILALATGGVLSGRSIYLYYDNQVPVLYDGVNLKDYQPFSSGVARLPKKASLQLKKDLPVLDGALALYPVYSAFATAVYPKGDYPLEGRYDSFYGTRDRNAYYNGDKHSVHFTNTIEGFEWLLQNKVDIYFMLEISEDQKAWAARKNIKLDYLPIGKEAFVFFVNADNPVDSLTTEQIRGIYSGKITDWKALGGKGKIKPFQRNKNSGSQTALEYFMKSEKIMEPPTTEHPEGMGGIIRQVANYKNYEGAIGFSFRYFSTEMARNNHIKLLKVNGIAPTVENIENGTYPLIAPFYAITRTDSKNPNVPLMLKWMVSGEGQYLIEKTGYVPANDKGRGLK